MSNKKNKSCIYNKNKVNLREVQKNINNEFDKKLIYIHTV